MRCGEKSAWRKIRQASTATCMRGETQFPSPARLHRASSFPSFAGYRIRRSAAWAGNFMAKDQRPLNLFLQALPAADFEALRSHLQTVELTRESVLIDAGDA